MKLYVCGEKSQNPEDWSIWSEWSLVIAENEDRAKQMSGEEIVTEIDMTKESYLVKMTEPNHGDDI